MKVPEKDSKGVFLLNRSLREHFRGVPDDFRGPEMNNRGAVELFRGLRKVSKGLERYRKGSKGLSRGRRVFRGQEVSFDGAKEMAETNIRLHARMKNASREDAKKERRHEHGPTYRATLARISNDFSSWPRNGRGGWRT